jgi:creatinine amidohydrolase/Fe(II)-dependent formamide hydrolase-like protein
MPRYVIMLPRDDTISESSVLREATVASREKGEKLATQLVDTMVEVVRQELGW